MKVLYLVNKFPVVSETFIRNEIEWMEKHGYLSGVVALDVNEELLQSISPGVRRKLNHCPFRYIGRFLRLFIAACWLLRAPSRFLSTWRSIPTEGRFKQCFWNVAADWINPVSEQPNIIHSHFAGTAAQYARYLSCLTGLPFTVCTHGYDIFFQPPPNYPELGKAAARILTISNYNRRYLVQHRGIPADNLEVIHCGIDVERFRRRAPYPEIGAGPLKLLSVGRLEPVKGHQYLIDACAGLLARRVDFRLEIIGDGKLRQQLQAQIESFGLGHRVLLRGAQPPEQVRRSLEQAHIFIMPSVSESMGVATMEAMAMELPVIGTRVRGVPELVEHGRSGLLVEPGDPAQLVKAISTLAKDRGLAMRLAREARRKVSDQFNAPVELSKLINVWSQCLDQKRAANKSRQAEGGN